MHQLAQAVEYIEEGDISKGLKLLKQLKQSEDREQLFATAQTYARFGLLNDAKEIASELLLQDPVDTEILLFLAECLLDLNEEDEAIDVLNRINKDDDDYLSALLLLADLYQSQGLEEVAEQKLLDAYKHDPNEPILQYALAEFYLSQGWIHEAIAYYEQCLDENRLPISIEQVYMHYAEALSMNGEFEKAITYYEKALAEDTDLEGLFKYGYTAFKAGKFHKAIKAFEDLRAADEQYSTLYPYLAKAYQEIGAFKEALETVKMGLTFDEYNEELYFTASQLSLKAGDRKQAETYLQNVLQLNPVSQKASQALLSLLKQDQRYEEVIEHILQMKSLGENEPVYEWDLAEAYNELEQYDKARQHFKAAYPFFEQHSPFLEQYGRFLMDEGQLQEALIQFKKAVHFDSEFAHLEDLIMELEDSNR